MMLSGAKHLDQHPARFQMLCDKGNTRRHADDSLMRAQRAVDGCGARFLRQLSASAVQRFIGELRDHGLSAQTCNNNSS